MRISKVFTKYDQPLSQINVPVMKDVEAESLSDNLDISIGDNLSYTKVLRPVAVEELLYGVKIVHYGEG